MERKQKELYEACALINIIQEVKTESYINWNISDTEEYLNNLLIAFLGEKYNEGIAKKLISELISIFYTDKMLKIKNKGNNQTITCGDDINLFKHKTDTGEYFFKIEVENNYYFIINKNELLSSDGESVGQITYDEDGLETSKSQTINNTKKTITRCKSPYEVNVEYYVDDELIDTKKQKLLNYNLLETYIPAEEFQDLLKGKAYYVNEEGYRFSFMPMQIPKYLPKLKAKTEKAYDSLQKLIKETRENQKVR